MEDTIDISKLGIRDELTRISKTYNKDDSQILKEALFVYEDYLNLVKEFDDWDLASDDDFVKFEKDNLK